MKEVIANLINGKRRQKKNSQLIKSLHDNTLELETEVRKFYEKVDFQFDNSFKIFDADKLIKTTNIDKTTINKAEGIMQNDFFLMNSLEVVSFGDKIDWNYQHHTSANTYQLYIQCLNVISHLSDAFVETNEPKYLYKAYQILLEWIYYVKTDNVKNRFKWVDHTVANRVMNIIYFYTVAKNEIEIDENIIGKLLIEHGDFLENDKNYVPNNHGIMVDRSIILLSIFMGEYPRSEQWFQKGKLRIGNAIYRDFSARGVHLENSPSYHLMTRRIFNQVEEFLKENKLSLGLEARQKIIQTKDYIQYMMKPNKEIPLIGDSQKGNVTWVEKSFESFSDNHAGITIMQSKDENESNSTWLSFICGYGRKTHKHRDDLSITLFYKGMDIFVDSGRYNYDSKDKFRQYFLSPRSHSTIHVLNKDYVIEDPFKNRNNIKTTDFLSNDVYDFVKGVNNSYSGILLKRSVIFFKPNIIIIHDDIDSEEEEVIQQIFNFAPDIEIADISNNEVASQVGNEKVVINQLLGSDDVKIYSGDRETPAAIISEEFGKLIDNRQAIFSKKGKKVEFLTLIKLGSDNRSLKNIEYIQDKKIVKVHLEDEDYLIKL